MKKKSVQSINPCNSVILTIYDIVKAQVGEIKVQSLPHRLAGLCRTGSSGKPWK